MYSKPLIITVKHKSKSRRFWRELWALIQWGAFSRRYYDDTPFDYNGHEGFSVSKRKLTDEIEIAFFETARKTDAFEQQALLGALMEVCQDFYPEVYFRDRNNPLF